jgi:predicted Zn-ribbon and HTH transcriptional regulator
MKSKNKPKESFVPVDRQETIRQKIISTLEGRTLSAKNISGTVRISEKEVYEHICHIQKTVHKRNYKLIITPAKCKRCGFSFKKREKIKKPGKCPICRSEAIREQFFSIR